MSEIVAVISEIYFLFVLYPEDVRELIVRARSVSDVRYQTKEICLSGKAIARSYYLVANCKWENSGVRKAFVVSVRAVARPKYIRFATNCDKVHTYRVSQLWHVSSSTAKIRIWIRQINCAYYNWIKVWAIQKGFSELSCKGNAIYWAVNWQPNFYRIILNGFGCDGDFPKDTIELLCTNSQEIAINDSFLLNS